MIGVSVTFIYIQLPDITVFRSDGYISYLIWQRIG